jgi:hypothetical protein
VRKTRMYHQCDILNVLVLKTGRSILAEMELVL